MAVSLSSYDQNSREVKLTFSRFLGPNIKPAHAYTDGSAEFESACQDLGSLHDTSTPYRPQTNGVAERAVRGVKEGTCCAFAQSGIHADWWAEGQTCFCFLQNM